ncbi:ExbD/TolR family protein [Derxia gummosa]|uniref:ExbD/TolR family protein n=1 Tax=Derxia gummosa DSM 723 TaxID=1121388 RepID=A0A8B6X5W2_9BURK|nr:biopolymer transporter ExbD [Derxia gummosa]
MALGTLDDSEDFNPEINTTPLVDVMLVLLVVFMVTLPMIRHDVNIDLPQASSTPVTENPTAIELAVDADGRVLWDKTALTPDELDVKLAQAAETQPQPEIRLSGDKRVAYEHVATVMAAVQRHGLTKLGFVMQPKDK